MLYCPMNSGYKQGYEVQYPSKDGQVPGLLVSIMKLRHSHFLAPPQGPWKDSCYLEVTASSMTGGSRPFVRWGLISRDWVMSLMQSVQLRQSECFSHNKR